MKRNFFASFAILAFALTVISCDKGPEIPMAFSSSGPCRLSVRVEGDGIGDMTKVATQTAANEGAMNDIQVFVFNTSTSKLDVAGHITAAVASLECSQGPREVWALVNSPKDYVSGPDAIADLASFKSITTRLTDNSAASFVMAGNVRTTLSASTEFVTVNVRRQVAAVCLKSLVNDMYVPAYQQNNKLKITGVFLGNVPGYQKIDSLNGEDTPSPISAVNIEKSLWISPNVKDADAAKLALTSDSINEYVQYSQALSKTYTLYSYPNDAPASESEVWSQRATMLVVEALVDGQQCIYPVQLGTLKANTRYEVTLVIHRIGRDDGDWWSPVKFDDVTPVVTVVDWTTGTSVNEEI